MPYAREGELSRLATLAGRNLMRNRTRTAAAMLAVVAGVASLMLASGFIEDLFHQLGEAVIHSQTGHVQLGKAGYFTYGSRSPDKYLMQFDAADSIAIESLPE